MATLGKLEAYALGSIAASFLAFSITLFVPGSFPVGFMVGALYLLVCVVAGFRVISRAKAVRFYAEMKPRELFWLPFLAYFLAPLWAAVELIVEDWRRDQPFVRFTVIGALFALSVVLLLVFMRVSGKALK
ncbi:MAG TPA: hypothetical protein VHD32_16335 [Candidatus Didemnitutus sp.]|nr:hypothetical protein [Candidatus Didemnitutus sp.]